MMFRDPTPVALWRDTILFWCRMAEAHHAAQLAIWASFLPPATEPPRPARREPAVRAGPRPVTQMTAPRRARRAHAPVD